MICILLATWSCKKEDIFLDRLEGTWNIDHLERYEIQADGTTKTLTDEENKKNKQVWSTYSYGQVNNVSYKLTYSMSK